MRTTNATLFVRFSVSVYRSWRIEYDKFIRHHQKFGVLSYCMYETADNPIDVTIVYEFKNANQAYEFARNEEFLIAMEQAGVVSSDVWVTHIVGCNTWESAPPRHSD